MRRIVFAFAVVCCFATQLVAADPAQCPWKLEEGRWTVADSSGSTGEVVWEFTADKQAVIGKWISSGDGNSTELGGWRPDKTTLVSTGYGKNGSYWEITFTTVTKAMIKGDMVSRLPDGTVFKGTYEVTRKNEDEMTSLAVGVSDGKEVKITGSFKRVK